MCKSPDYLNNCANCANASKKQSDQPCGDCIEHELTTKQPYSKWEKKP